MTRILVPTDFSTRSLEALRLAVQYVKRARGELLLLHVVEGEPVRWSAENGLPETPAARLDPTDYLVSHQGHRSSSPAICARRPNGSWRPCNHHSLTAFAPC
jgi:nucleotide-binding universal stress UspA family protein